MTSLEQHTPDERRFPYSPGSSYSSGAMAKVTVETVEHVARLAHLSLTDAERETFARQLDQILAYAESIQALDTSGVPPMTTSHAGGQPQLRPDTPAAGLSRDDVLDAAPDPAAGPLRGPTLL